MVAALAVAACGGGSDATGGAAGENVLTFGVNTAILSIDPAKDGTGVPSTVRALAYEPLIRMNTDGSVGPALAESWEYVEDSASVFELTVRQDASFSDGTPVDAAAVAGWLEYFVEANGPTASLMSVDSVDEVDEWTVRINLAEPNPIVPQLLSDLTPWGAVAAPGSVAQPDLLATETNGAGPYMLDPAATVENDHYTYVPNPHYYDTSAVRFDRVEVRVISDSASMLQSIRAGQLDAAVGDPATADAAASAGLTVITEDSGSTGLVILDRDGTSLEPLGDVRVRQALNHAIDRAAITEALVGSYGTPSSQQQTADGFDPAYQDWYDYDPQKARDLLADAGYADGFVIPVVSSQSAGNLGDPVARAMAKYFQDIGVELEITPSGPDFFTEVATGDYPVIQMNMDTNLTWVRYEYIFPEGAFFNVFGADDPVRDLAEQAVAGEDPAAIWPEISRRVTEEAIFIPAFTVGRSWYVTDDLEGVSFSPQRTYPMVGDWYRP